MVVGGDFRQVLPVVRFADRSQLVAASLKSSELWPSFETIPKGLDSTCLTVAELDHLNQGGAEFIAI